MNKILTREQAYLFAATSHMFKSTNPEMRAHVRIGNPVSAQIVEYPEGDITVWAANHGPVEAYDNLEHFSKEYEV